MSDLREKIWGAVFNAYDTGIVMAESGNSASDCAETIDRYTDRILAAVREAMLSENVKAFIKGSFAGDLEEWTPGEAEEFAEEFAWDYAEAALAAAGITESEAGQWASY